MGSLDFFGTKPAKVEACYEPLLGTWPSLDGWTIKVINHYSLTHDTGCPIWSVHPDPTGKRFATSGGGLFVVETDLTFQTTK